MRVTRKDFEAAWEDQSSLDVYSRARFESFLDRLGVEIVPDPEPEPPPKPWRLDLGPEPLTVRIRDANDKIIVEVRLVNDGANIPDQVRWLMALVSAYNAAGERKRITVRVSREAEPNWWTISAPGYHAGWGNCSKEWVIGKYIIDCADRLGLEIVEP